MKTSLQKLFIVAIFFTCATITASAFTGTVVSSKTMWYIASDVASGTELSVGTTSPVEQSGGLYLRGATGSHAVVALAKTITVNIYGNTLNLTNVYSDNGLDLTTALTADPTKDASATVTTGNDRCLALNAGVPGHLLVYMRPTALTANRNVNIFFNGTDKLAKACSSWSVVDGTTSPAYEMIDVENTAEGTYYIGSAQGWNIAAIVFVPTSEYNESLVNTGTDTATDNLTITSKAINDGKMYNIYGQKVDSNYRGIYILNGKKYMRKE